MRSPPTISVVTVCLNSERHLKQTIESVQAQLGVDVEHVVVDGGSADGTLEILRASAGPHLRWISEPDKGIADAMNKGLALSQGEWLLFLQSDDYLAGADVLARACAHLRDHLDLCAFPVYFGDGQDQRINGPRGDGFWINFKTGFNHQGTLIRRGLFDRIGNYDIDFRIAMDYEFFLRAHRFGARTACHDEPVLAIMRGSGISSMLDWANLEKRLGEERSLHAKWKTAALAPLYAVWWSLYPSYRKLRARG